MKRRILTVIKPDKDAAEIAELYRQARMSIIESVRFAITCSADDCVLFCWATAPMLPHALEVMEAWGFRYITHAVWNKNRTGTGYWLLNKHELPLIGAHGNVPAPAPGTQWASVIDAARGRHSEKPDVFYELIEHYFPKIELYARRARPGWDVWGLEAPE